MSTQASPSVATSMPPPTLSAAADELAQRRSSQYLTFVLGGETFAIGILAIKEIIQCSGITPVPKMPVRIRGVINLRGAVLPVLDLAACLSDRRTEVSKRTCVVIVEIELGKERQDIGIMVDAVNAVLDIPAADMEPAPPFGVGIRSDFIQGMGRINGQFIVVLNISKTLALQGEDWVGTLPTPGELRSATANA